MTRFVAAVVLLFSLWTSAAFAQCSAGNTAACPSPSYNNVIIGGTLTVGGVPITGSSGGGISALTGDVTATGNGSVASTLATVNSNVGSFTNASITVNAKGLVTAASSGSGSGLSLTTTGTSGAATLTGSTLNIPQYLAPAGSGAALTGLLWSQIGTTPTTLGGYGITDALGLAGGTVTGATTFSFAGTALTLPTGSNMISNGTLAVVGDGGVNALLVVQPASAGTEGLILTPPTTGGAPIKFGTVNAGGFDFAGQTEVVRSFAYSGTTTFAQQGLLVDLVPSGTSADTGQYSLNEFETFPSLVSSKPFFTLSVNSITGTGFYGASSPLFVGQSTPSAFGTLAAWAISTAYSTLGQEVSNGTNIYALVTAGTSAGSGGPTGTGANITDGSAHWRYVDILANGLYFVGFQVQENESRNMGGTSSGAIGGSFAADLACNQTSAVTYQAGCVVEELDDFNLGTAGRRVTQQLVREGPAAINIGGTLPIDAIVSISNSDNAGPAPVGYAVGQYQALFNPISATGDFAQVQSTNGVVPHMAAFIDANQAVFDGAPTTGIQATFIGWANSALLGNGDVQIGYSLIHQGTNGPVWDLSYQVPTAAICHAGALGSGYTPSSTELVQDASGNVWVLTATVGGTCSSLALQTSGHAVYATGSPCASNCTLQSLTASSNTGPTGFKTAGSGATADITWAAASSPTLTLGGTASVVIPSSGVKLTGLTTGTQVSCLGLNSSNAIVLVVGGCGTSSGVNANGLNSATTTVAVSAATAPTANQVLTASNSTTAAWVTPTVGNLTGPITSTGLATSVAAQTGTGSTFVMNTSPTLVTPNLGTPSFLLGTSITGTATGFTVGAANGITSATTTVATSAATAPTSGQVLTASSTTAAAWVTPTAGNLTGPITSTGLATAVAAQTGTGSTFVMNTSPTLVTPNLGTPSFLVGTSISGTAASLTAGIATTANGLTSATTTVAVSAATAPTSGQVLTASSTVLATWATPSVAVGGITGLGTGVATGLAIAVGTAGSPVLNGGAGGTPSSITLTNALGTAASLTAGTATVANGLKTATTTVVISAATAPTSGQVLTASSTVLAAWAAPAAVPISTGVSGLGTGVATALGNTPNAASGMLTYSIVGTSGATLGLLNANKTDSGGNTYSGSNTFSSTNSFTGAVTFGAVNGKSSSTSIGYTVAATDCGTTIFDTDASANNITVPNSIVPAAGTVCIISVVQLGLGKDSVVGSGTTVVQSAHSYTGTSAQYAIISLVLTTTAGGTPTVYLTGDAS